MYKNSCYYSGIPADPATCLSVRLLAGAADGGARRNPQVVFCQYVMRVSTSGGREEFLPPRDGQASTQSRAARFPPVPRTVRASPDGAGGQKSPLGPQHDSLAGSDAAKRGAPGFRQGPERVGSVLDLIAATSSTPRAGGPGADSDGLATAAVGFHAVRPFAVRKTQKTPCLFRPRGDRMPRLCERKIDRSRKGPFADIGFSRQARTWPSHARKHEEKSSLPLGIPTEVPTHVREPGSTVACAVARPIPARLEATHPVAIRREV